MSSYPLYENDSHMSMRLRIIFKISLDMSLERLYIEFCRQEIENHYHI